MIAEFPGRRMPAWIGLLFVALAVAAFPLDLVVSQWFSGGAVHAALDDILATAEAFGNGAGLPCFAGLIWLLAPRDRRRLPRLLTAALASGLLADAIKLLVCRARPIHFSMQHPLGTASDTFQGWLTFGGGGWRMQSFPSAHAALAFGLIVSLIRLYPAGKPLFLALGVAVCLHRITVGMHYPSDVLCGAALGWLVGCACHHGTALARAFDALERRWAGGAVDSLSHPVARTRDHSAAA